MLRYIDTYLVIDVLYKGFFSIEDPLDIISIMIILITIKSFTR